MEKILIYAQVATGILMMASILVQQRGATLGSAFGGESVMIRSRRGAEKWLFRISIVLSVIFIALSIAILFY